MNTRAPVAQRTRVAVFYTVGWGFESLRARHISCGSNSPDLGPSIARYCVTRAQSQFESLRARHTYGCSKNESLYA